MKIAIHVLYDSLFDAVHLRIRGANENVPLEEIRTQVYALVDSLNNVNPDNITILPEDFGLRTIIIWNFSDERESVRQSIIVNVGKKAMDYIDYTVQRAEEQITKGMKMF